MPSKLKPLDRPAGLADQVYKTLREHLGSHVIRPGQRLQEAALALQLGVSRTPVREALARLESDGLIAVEGRSFVVPVLTESDIDEIFELRAMLEPAALSKVARDVDAASVDEMEAILHEAEAADRDDDAEAFIDTNARFHAAWHARVGNRRLMHAIALHAGHVRFLRVLTLGSGNARVAALQGMRNIVAALREHDAGRAARIMGEHLDQARLCLQQVLAEIERESAGEDAAPERAAAS